MDDRVLGLCVEHRTTNMSALTGFLCAFAPLRLCVESVPGHFGINLLAPRGDAAFDTLEILESLLPQEVQRLQP